ncbi:DOMON-like domain-containing protein [Shumkonia mesophila]|uniref:DOMON-like domain-containing protein n=1 Tax=Shumkonia mesophila TaxID=2838854 RepID=UPI002934EDD4|nr:DOMON-like domain-containing protein [Shumkonia mesophila]
MRQTLTLHPDSRCWAAARIEVDAVRPRPGALALTYVVTGAIGDLRLPAVAAAARTGRLWRHTCFEAFVGAPPGGTYYEFNFAPSMAWAAYRFASYRKDMGAADVTGAPRIEAQSAADRYTLHAALDLEGLPGLPDDGPWRLGLAAVIEEIDGRLSYWALAHPPGQADFHHPDGFVHELRAVERA